MLGYANTLYYEWCIFYADYFFVDIFQFFFLQLYVCGGIIMNICYARLLFKLSDIAFILRISSMDINSCANNIFGIGWKMQNWNLNQMPEKKKEMLYATKIK